MKKISFLHRSFFQPLAQRQVVFANEQVKQVWYTYPRWTKDATEIVYHAGGKLFHLTLADVPMRQVSADDKAD